MNVAGVCVSASTPETSVRQRLQQAYHAITGTKYRESVKRVPVDQQYIASYLSAEKRGEKVHHPASKHFHDVLYKSIIRLVASRCIKYTGPCRADVDELAQGCYIRITNRIGTYNRHRSAFSTWVWSVCGSSISSRIRSQIRRSSVISDESIENYGGTVNDSAILGKDIVDTVREIAVAYPNKKKILFGIFGNPDREDFHLPTDICVSEVSREVGASYGEVYSFYHNVVVKFFEKRFPGESEGEKA
jgi:hypothetical protein